MCIYGNDDVYEPDQTAAEARPFTVGETQTHGICIIQNGSGTDNDWVRFTVPETATYRLETSNVPESTQTTLVLYNATGTTLLANDVGTIDPINSRRMAVIQKTLGPGTYTVRAIASFANNPPNRIYDLSIVLLARNVPHLTPTPTWPAGTPTPTITPTPAPAQIATEVAMRQNINNQRIGIGLPPLADHPSLDQAARQHSQDMEANSFVGHTGTDGSQPIDRARQAGYSMPVVSDYAGEVAAGGGMASDPVDLWMQSAGHRAALLSPLYREGGVGSSGNYHAGLVGKRTNVYPVFINNDAALTTARLVTVTLTIDQQSQWYPSP